MPAKVNLDSVTFYSTNIFRNKKYQCGGQFSGSGGQCQLLYIHRICERTGHRSDIQFQRSIVGWKIYPAPLFNDSSYINPGDQVTIEMHCVDNPVWQYFNTLGQARGNNAQAITPANPLSNISNHALGYFSAQTKQSALSILQ